MKAIQRILTAHKRYVKRKRLGSFLALEINCAVLMMEIILLCCGCNHIMMCLFMFVVLLYNYGWFRCELDGYKDMVLSKKMISLLYNELSFWQTLCQRMAKGQLDELIKNELGKEICKSDFEEFKKHRTIIEKYKDYDIRTIARTVE